MQIFACLDSNDRFNHLARIIREEWIEGDFWVRAIHECDKSGICFDRVTDSKAVSRVQTRILTSSDTPWRGVATKLGVELQKVGGLYALSTQTTCDLTEGEQKRKRRGQVNDKPSYRNHYPSTQLEQPLAQ